MLSRVLSAALALPLLISFGAASPVKASTEDRPVERATDTDAVHFTNDWPGQFCAGSVYDFSWQGGSSGKYNLWAWVDFPGLPSPHESALATDTDQTRYRWQAPYWKDLNPNTTYSFSLLDTADGVNAYSPTIPVGHCV